MSSTVARPEEGCRGRCQVDMHVVAHTLGYSRRFLFWNTDREDAEHT
jgi:hypothetical protein